MAKAATQHASDSECLKARGATGIRYPFSPSCKRWPLGVGLDSVWISAVANAVRGPQGEYGGNAEI